MKTVNSRMTENPLRLARALFAPDSVALIGASADAEKNTGRPQRYLADHGYPGRVVPINPNRDRVQGVEAFKAVADAPGPIDHAFIMVPATAVPAAIEDCVRAGVTIATVYTDGFAETGCEGRRLQEQLVATARAGGLRLIGPNCMGIICPASRLMLSVNAILESTDLPVGRLGIISQSGSMLGAMLSRGAARDFGFSRMISIGNEADLGVGEVMDLLVDDDATDSILLFLESVRDGAAIGAAARRAFAAGKPVIAYKLGRSAEGREIAISHSGALAGEDAAADAFFRANAIARVDVLETLIEAPPLLVHGAASGRRVAVITTTGGGAATIVDRLGEAGLELVGAPPELRALLAQYDIDVSGSRLIDLTMAGAREGVYGKALRLMLDSDACDAVVCVVGSSGQFHPEVAVAPIRDVAAGCSKPVAVYINPQADASLKLLADAGIAAFRTPEACADGLRAALRRTAPAAPPASPTASIPSGEDLAVDRTFAEDESLAFMAALGIPVVPHRVLLAPGDGADLTFPVAAKVLSADIPHKTDAGGVRLGIADPAALSAARADILATVGRHHPAARIDGLMVQEMQCGLGEVLVGFRLDPQFGPLVILAAGGVLAEVYEDRAIRLAPIDHDTAREMIDDVRGLAPLRGYRGLPLGDLMALADVLVRLSDLARVPGIAEAEINPLVVMRAGQGVVAVDGLVVSMASADGGDST